MPDLAIYLFGMPNIELHRHSLTVDTRKATALLAYLAVTGKRHSRDSLATLLWPDYDQSHARSALRRTLSVLQKALDGGFLLVTRDAISLELDERVEVDVVRFQQHVLSASEHKHPVGEPCSECTHHLEQAFALYRGDFMTGFSLRDSASFDEWQFFETDSLKREFGTVLEALISTAIETHQLTAALEYAQRWLSLDALREDVHRILMLIYAWTDRRNAALRQYRECLRILDQELGVPPLEETTRLYQAILENDIPPLPGKTWAGSSTETQVAAPEETIPPKGYPLIGRSFETEIIEQAYQHYAPSGHILVLEGEPGIGKTRLAEAFLASVQSRGAVIINTRSYPGEASLAYGPLISGLQPLLARADRLPQLEKLGAQWQSEAARLLPEILISFPKLPPPTQISGPGEQSYFFEGMRQLILAILEGPLPGVIFLDDLQWADSASMDLLNYLVRRINGHPILILATWVDHSLPAAHLQFIAEAQRRGIVTRLHLERLKAADILDLVRVASQNRPGLPPDFGERLYEETEGLPFFAIEYIETILADRQVPVGQDASLSSTGAGQWELPPAVRAALMARLSAAGDSGWQLLSTAALIGRSFDFDTLLAASGRPEIEAISTLEKLITLGLIEEEPDTHDGRVVYDFTHDLLRRLAYEEISLTRRRLVHRRIADDLVIQTRRRSEPRLLAAQVAFHYHASGQEVKAAEYYFMAGEYAREVRAYQEAISNYRAALSSGHPDPSLLHEAIGDLLTRQGDYRLAMGEYETCAALSEPSPHLEQKIGNLHHRRGEWELAACHYQLALDQLTLQDDPERRARILADWSLTAHNWGQADEAMRYAQQSLKLAESNNLHPALASAHNILGILARQAGHSQEALRHLQESLAIARQLNDLDAQAAALNNLALVFQDIQDIPQAINHTQEALAICQNRGDRHREAALLNHLADLYHLAENQDMAMAYLKQAVAIFSEIGITEGNLLPEIWKLTEW